MSSYRFTAYVAHHGYQHGSGDFIEISKQSVWQELLRDPEFLKLKLYKILVKHERPASIYFSGNVEYITSLHWVKSLAEARRLGEVIELVADFSRQPPKKNQLKRKDV